MIKRSTIDADQNLTIFIGFSVAILIGIFGAILLRDFIFLLVPIVALIVFITLVDSFKIYQLFFLLLPFSLEYTFPNGLGTDIPAEALMIGLSFITIFYIANNLNKISLTLITNPVFVMVGLHVFWIFIAMLYSQDITISFKYFLAKLWYVLPFFLLPFFLLNGKKAYQSIFTLLSFSMFLAVTYVMIRHSDYGFTFKDINAACAPIFRNHVNYASILIITIPIVWTLYRWSEKGSKQQKWFLFLIFYFVVAVYLTFTRAALVSLLLAIISYYFIHWRLFKTSAIIVLVTLVMGVNYLIQDDNYIKLAPNYEQTVTHYTLDDIVEATYKLKDISTMERVNRWVAGFRMIQEHPIVGFGPATFYSFYKGYLETLFKTYVTDNPEKSGIHNYYLMVTVEQGIVGGLIFLLLVIISLFQGVNLYYNMKGGYHKDLVMMAILLLVIIGAILLINDMLETAKVGPFFFLALAIITKEKIHWVSVRNKEQ